ncbi:hypothetical protein LEP1GSC120_0613 [Leptospira santarosai str. 200702252]|nr:hypothetical protein LEP1GSC130_2185 [Leptospira santarosai str. 200403458]EMO97362.1 hypothetical protein LEP1GSC120_0613 [Leptospira santarosai str. 200702252]
MCDVETTPRDFLRVRYVLLEKILKFPKVISVRRQDFFSYIHCFVKTKYVGTPTNTIHEPHCKKSFQTKRV